jgi:hypothetical protein
LKSDAVFELSASPNPVPVGADTGTTTIRWSTPDAGLGKIYISKEKLGVSCLGELLRAAIRWEDATHLK